MQNVLYIDMAGSLSHSLSLVCLHCQLRVIIWWWFFYLFVFLFFISVLSKNQANRGFIDVSSVLMTTLMHPTKICRRIFNFITFIERINNPGQPKPMKFKWKNTVICIACCLQCFLKFAE